MTWVVLTMLLCRLLLYVGAYIEVVYLQLWFLTEYIDHWNCQRPYSKSILSNVGILEISKSFYSRNLSHEYPTRDSHNLLFVAHKKSIKKCIFITYHSNTYHVHNIKYWSKKFSVKKLPIVRIIITLFRYSFSVLNVYGSINR